MVTFFPATQRDSRWPNPHRPIFFPFPRKPNVFHMVGVTIDKSNLKQIIFLNLSLIFLKAWEDVIIKKYIDC